MSRYHRRRGGDVGRFLADLAYAAVTTVAAGTVAVGYRARWALAPLYVAALCVPTGWVAAVFYVFVPDWTYAGFVIATVCAVAFVWKGCRGPYDQGLAGVVAAVCLSWCLAVAHYPGWGALYGVWALTWPLLGLPWWAGSAFRSTKARARVKSQWSTWIGKATGGEGRVTRTLDTETGTAVTYELGVDGTQHADARRVELAGKLRPGSVVVEHDRKNAARATVHHIDREPWADGETTHPILILEPTQ